MSIIKAVVDGIPSEIIFELQDDGWYYNKEFNLNINSTLNRCFTESLTNPHDYPVEVNSFKVLKEI